LVSGVAGSVVSAGGGGGGVIGLSSGGSSADSGLRTGAFEEGGVVIPADAGGDWGGGPE
jgi:hypothetical protein